MVAKAALALAGLLALIAVSTASADGEAGVVIDFGGGDVRSYCVAFEGDGIRGDDLLAAAGLSVDSFRAGGPSTLCSINGVGCESSGTFDSCFCECQSGGSSCRYWSFFTRDYGSGGWLYSALAFDLSTANDGDLHAWRWGQGSPNNAPAPADTTFEAVCGHPPQGGPSPPATNTSPPPPPTTAPGFTPTHAGTVAPGTPFTPLPGGTVTLIPSPSFEASAAPSPQPSPAPPATGEDDEDDDDESGAAGIVVFGAVMVVLLAAIGGGAYWRSRNGS